nr:hypothetical protein [Escherichia coli]
MYRKSQAFPIWRIYLDDGCNIGISPMSWFMEEHAQELAQMDIPFCANRLNTA